MRIEFEFFQLTPCFANKDVIAFKFQIKEICEKFSRNHICRVLEHAKSHTLMSYINDGEKTEKLRLKFHARNIRFQGSTI